MHTSTYIWIGVVVVAVGYLWWTGQLTRLADYVRETREELRKCTWPTWNELKGSTVVVIISIALLGGFTCLMDVLFAVVMPAVTSWLS